ncbi:aldo/keto reductase [bacterium]|nr:aldo/keto reductase [bacterium]
MNRREFIKTSVAILALTALGGCKKEAKTSEKKRGTMTYREFPGIGAKVSLLGYGLMRMPKVGGGPEIDKGKGFALIDEAMKGGINYYDTAWFYHDGLSETFAGEALSRYPRDSYNLASKLPMRLLESGEQAEEIFNKQLEKCKVDYFDFYLLHNLNGPLWEKTLHNGAVDFAMTLKGTGKIKRLGFSFHGDNKDFPKILDYTKWDFVQIQANYYDWDTFSKEQYEEATKRGIPVVIMEPLRGGELAKLRPDAREVLETAKPGSTPAQWAFRYIAEKENVLTVLSGMTQMEHLKENLTTFSPMEPLSEEEEKTLQIALKTYRESGIVPCTGCRYCTPCPAGVAIPDIFKIYNDYRRTVRLSQTKKAYEALGKDAIASACVECGACLKKCPQSIDIPKELKRIHKELQG